MYSLYKKKYNIHMQKMFQNRKVTIHNFVETNGSYIQLIIYLMYCNDICNFIYTIMKTYRYVNYILL